MFKALAYCNQRYINSLKLVRERLENADEHIAEDIASFDAETDEITDGQIKAEGMSKAGIADKAGRKERKYHGHGIFK